jgi:hypothetical protein
MLLRFRYIIISQNQVEYYEHCFVGYLPLSFVSSLLVKRTFDSRTHDNHMTSHVTWHLADPGPCFLWRSARVSLTNTVCGTSVSSVSLALTACHHRVRASV